MSLFLFLLLGGVINLNRGFCTQNTITFCKMKFDVSVLQKNVFGTKKLGGKVTALMNIFLKLVEKKIA